MFGLFPAVGLSLVVLGVIWHEAIVWLLFPWVVFVSLRTARMYCPTCRRPVGSRRVSVLGVRFQWDSPLTPKACVHCGSSLGG